VSEVGQSLELAKQAAKEKGQVVVLPNDNELFLDIDDAESMAMFESCSQMMSVKVHLEWSVKPSPSGRPGRFHVTVKMPRPVTPLERIAIQAFMGSDRKRECLSWCRLQDGEETVTRLFEKPTLIQEDPFL
jgi:hypothetical protein